MALEIVAADADLSRWLSWVSKPTRAKRWTAKGETWVLERGEWVTRRHAPEPHEMRRNGRAPLMAFDAGVMLAADALKPSQGDVDDAMRGLEPTPVETADGGVRLDYKSIPLKNADGTLTKYAKNLMDLHAPQARKGAEVSLEVSEQVDKALATVKAEAIG